MIILDYVISATAYGVLPHGTITGGFTEFHDPFKRGILSFSNILQKNLKESCKRFDPTISLLFNAFYEPNLVDIFRDLDRFNLKSVYADSGGLQIVTVGKEANSTLREEIYKVQTYSDYAMCFDVIPLKSTSKERTKNERSNISNKVFIKEDFDAAGRATAQNIKQQIDAFRRMGASTKVLLILQGNTAENMLSFYRNIADQLSEDDYRYVGGIAVADTCIGTGTLETIEMLYAARLVGRECHPSVRGQIHLLGVGSLERIRPVIYLGASGYLDEFRKISFDSSTHTSSFDHGNLYRDGKAIKLGRYKTPTAEKHFRNTYDMFSGYLQSIVTQDEFIDLIFGVGKYNQATTEWKHSQLKARAKALNNPEKAVAGLFAKPMHTFWQIDNFMNNLNKMWVEKVPRTYNPKTIRYLQKLRHVKDDESMKEWMAEFYYVTKSKRIKTSKTSSLRELMI